ncbi:bifunctional diguanylate cyclase/phosphodiesterase [Demequina sp. NBRC 110055]|uniref:putative bifunctional diguanylate cyclase/phosphodiesterase n=1 Tax=Demequina sp. NBRC 110055 TaxID=1570344 RepID=UPI0013563F85|nr:EAL domain-containing protein [Demequina sp. NBRC 110055]
MIFLAIAAIIGEAKPIQLVLGDSESRTLSTSSPFVLALIPVAGVGVAVLVQVLASLTDDVLQRRQVTKSLFNVAQYSVSVLAGGLVYTSLTSTPLLSAPTDSHDAALGPLLLAGITMVVVNWILVAIVVTLASREKFLWVLRTDAQFLIITHLVLLSVGAIAADVASDGVWVIALLAGPVIAAHLFAASGARHAHEASHDMLTGLGNRGSANHRLAQTLADARNRGADGPGLVLIDLDHFKDVNDTLGHPVGDIILREVGARIVKAAPEDASVHRLGGDEFAIIVEGDHSRSRAAAAALLEALEDPVKVDGLELLVRASIGIAVAPFHGSDSESLMKHADIALYHAKVERDRVSVYSPEFDVNTVERLQLLADLRSALGAGDLHVVYQPQVDLQSGRVVALEALVRWNHPRRGNVSPEEFIPVAENSGLIFTVTSFVLDSAISHVARWRDGGHDVRVAVNLSARHLSDLGLPHQVSEVLERHGVPPEALVLEVTETGIMADAVRADLVIKALRELGVAVAIDDYGTGNASLTYLRRLEIDELKVDRTFVSNINADNHDLIIVRSTIELALALGLRVVAEGVEDERTAQALATFGAVIGQGYHLGHPVPAEQIDALLTFAHHTARGD